MSRLFALMACAAAVLACGVTVAALEASGATGSSTQGSSLEAWGEDDVGQVGDGMPVGEPVRSPVAVSNIQCAVSAAVNAEDSYAVLANGEVEAWGEDSIAPDVGDLGDGGAREPYSLVPVGVAPFTTATQVSADIPDTYVLLANGKIFGWGDDRYGELGNGEDLAGGSTTPVQVAKSLSDVKAIAASVYGTLALRANGEVDSWGDEIGAEALGRSGPSNTPGPVEREASGEPLEGVSAVAAGVDFGLALVSGEVKAWGAGDPPESTTVLGAGEKAIPGKVPVTVGGEKPLKEVTAIAAGSNFGLALVKGAVWAWGANQLGELGQGTTSEGSYLPVAVTGLPANIVAIAATELTGFALDSEGHVWAWGNNTQGELGIGSSETHSATPVEISSLGAGNRGLSGGNEAQHEVVVGPTSASCESGTQTTSTPSTSTSQSASSATSTSASTQTTTTQSTTTQTQQTPPGQLTGPTVAQLALECSSRKLSLTDVTERDGHVALDGVAATSLLGKQVQIVFDGKQKVASVTVSSDGLFSTTAPLPPPKLRTSNSARYQANAGGLQSLDLKLSRRLILDPPSASGGHVKLTGQVTLPLAKPIKPVLVQQQLSCTKTKIVDRFKPSASGRFTITIPAPSGQQAAIYRLSTQVRGSTHSSQDFGTFSLPLPVQLG